MRFRDDDQLLAMDVVRDDEDPDVFVVFENGLAKRTPVGQYRVQGSRRPRDQGGQAVRASGGDLVGALMVDEDDEVLVVMEKGKIVRSRVDEVPATGPEHRACSSQRRTRRRDHRRGPQPRATVGEDEVEELVDGDAADRR